MNKRKKAKNFFYKNRYYRESQEGQGDLEINLGAHAILSDVITMHVYYSQHC